MRYSDKELSLINNTFSDNDGLVVALRKAFFQHELNQSEKEKLSNLSDEVISVLYRTFVPEVESEIINKDLFQVADLFLSVLPELKGNGVEEAYPHILAKDLEKRYLLQQLSVIKGDSVDEMIQFNQLRNIGGKDMLGMYVDLTAFLYLMSYIDSNLNQLLFLAGDKKETIEETKERLEKDSSK